MRVSGRAPSPNPNLALPREVTGPADLPSGPQQAIHPGRICRWGVHLFRGESTHPRIGGPPRSTRRGVHLSCNSGVARGQPRSHKQYTMMCMCKQIGDIYNALKFSSKSVDNK